MSRFIKYPNITDDIRAIRETVFIKEQGFLPENEYDSNEDKSTHCCLYEGDVLVAYARCFLEGGIAHIGRVSVLREFRGKGYGARIIGLAEKEISNCGGLIIEISAQIRTRGFYEKQGYEACGDIFIGEGVPHIRMRKINQCHK
ncbi:MAG: GNAT family N-acetyltransferase [Clostridiaceae bacterium]|jgi:predicted GNAT family N-acyltransferase|nr:GNAT family N-acetyltransferase [Clostridiaceae bacterium]